MNSVLVNNLASGTGSRSGGAAVLVLGGAFSSTFVSAVGNDGDGAVYLDAGSSAWLGSSIYADNDSGYIIDGITGSSLSVEYSNVFNSGTEYNTSVFTDPTGSDGNISSDPMFVSWTDDDDYSDDDLHLASGSPSVDAGVPAYLDADGSPADQGAYGGPDGSW
jgi:hypothetical protein